MMTQERLTENSHICVEPKACGQVRDSGLNDRAEVHMVQGKAELEKLDTERLGSAARTSLLD